LDLERIDRSRPVEVGSGAQNAERRVVDIEVQVAGLRSRVDRQLRQAPPLFSSGSNPKRPRNPRPQQLGLSPQPYFHAAASPQKGASKAYFTTF
jgi:hypothetical protein